MVLLRARGPVFCSRVADEGSEMKLIVAGSRTITDFATVNEAIGHFVKTLAHGEIAEIVSGRARGVDKLGEQWACANGVPVAEFPADWKAGKGAGFARNARMAEYADALLAIWDGQSHGTEDMIRRMREAGKLTAVATAHGAGPITFKVYFTRSKGLAEEE